MIDIWRDDENVVFDYGTVAKPYLDPFTLEEIATALYDETVNSLGQLSIIRLHDEEYAVDVFFVNPRGEAFTFLYEQLTDEAPFYRNLDLSIRTNLEWVTVPVYQEDDGYSHSHLAFYEFFKTLWIDGELETVCITASTDFYEKRGAWPHARVGGSDGHLAIPLMFIAEILVQGKKAYIFCDLDEEAIGIPIGTHPTLFITNAKGQDAIIVFEDSDFPSSIEMLPWNGKHLPTMLRFMARYEDAVDASKNYVPQKALYKTIDTCQAIVSIQEPYTVPVIQFPMYWIRTPEDPRAAGDSNSLLVFTDGNGGFSSYYRQT
jgi:hypothetical protein